jgi:hypothetical protein
VRTGREEYTEVVSKKRALRRISGPRREEITGYRRNCTKSNIIVYISLPHISILEKGRWMR